MTDGTYQTFSHQNQSFVNFQMAEQITDQDFNWDKLHLKSVHNIIKLFTGIMIVKIGDQTIVLVTHGQFFSIYEIVLQKWLNHLEFEDDILCMFRHYKDKDSRYQSLLLKNGQIYIGAMNYDASTEMIATSKRSAAIAGTILRWSEDVENNQTFYVIHKDGGGDLKASVLYRGAIKTVSLVDKPENNVSIACLQYRGEDSKVVIQNGKKLLVCTQTKGELTKDNEYTGSEITGNIYSGCGYDIKKNIFLFDAQNMYMIKINNDGTNTVKVNKNVYCIGFQNFTMNFNYAICQQTNDSTCPGLRMFDMESTYAKDKFTMVLLKQIDIGTCGQFEFGASVIRFAFISSLTSIIVTPVLHRNTNKFLGIRDTTDYICFNSLKEKYCALRKNGDLLTWNLLTCKYEEKVETKDLNLKDYTLFSKYKHGRVLLRSNAEVPDQKIEDYFQPYELRTIMDKQTSFVSTTKFTYKKYRYLEIVAPDEVKIHLEYVHPSYEKEWIFINDRMDSMVTVLTNYRCYYYRAATLPNDDPLVTRKIKWELIRQIPDYPADLENDAFRLEFFTPCQSRYLILDKKTREFIVKDSVTGSELFRLPKEILTVEKDSSQPNQAINRIKWIDATTMRIVNKDGFEKIVDIDQNCKELSYNFRPLFNNIDGNEWESVHYYVLRKELTTNQILMRLKRIYQDYKSNYFLEHRRGMINTFDLITKVDISKLDFSESSFSYSHWSLIEQIVAGKMKIADIEASVVEFLVYDVLPGGNSIFHMLTSNKSELQALYDVCHPEKELKIHVPYLPNFKGETVIQKCLDNLDYKSIDKIVECLSLYPIGHHSKAIKHHIPMFIKEQLPSFLSVYLDSRFQQTEQIKKITKGALKERFPEIIVGEIWFQTKDITGQLFAKEEDKRVETSIKLEYLDLYGIYHYTDSHFNEIFYELSETKRLDFFNNRAIQKLIEFNYTLVQGWITYFVIGPFLVFHVTFVVYMNEVFIHMLDSTSFNIANIVMSIALLVFSVYFLLIEVVQFSKQGLRYFSQMWTYIDIIAPAGVIYTQIQQFDKYYDVIEYYPNHIATIQAITTFFMWLKVIYILRIFRVTGYLVRLIIVVIYDMGVFLFIFLLTVLAFGDSFLKVNFQDDPSNNLFQGNFVMAALFSYQMILGSYTSSAFGSVALGMVWTLFVGCTLIGNIVMLNLLISIIGDTYGRMISNADQAAYQEMASLICENSFIIPLTAKQYYAPKHKFLVCLTDLEQIQKESPDPVQDKLIQLLKNAQESKKTLTEISTKVQALSDDNAKNKKELMEKLEAMTKKIEEQGKGGQVAVASKIVYEKFISKIHEHEVNKMTLKQLRVENPAYTSFGCDARFLTSCLSGYTEKSEYNKDRTVEWWVCMKCNFGYCVKCYETRKNAHNHPLTKMTLPEMGMGENAGYLCDAIYFKGCLSQGNTTIWKDEDTVLYHDPICNFDLCQSCMDQYKGKL